MIDPSTRTRFHPEWNLKSWHPQGALDAAMATFMVHYISFEERISHQAFNRFIDLSELKSIDLNPGEIAALASERVAPSEGLTMVKTAFFAPHDPTHQVAEMFATLTHGSPIEVRVFRGIHDAAQWLGVPAMALKDAS